MSFEELNPDIPQVHEMAEATIQQARKWQTFFDNLTDYNRLGEFCSKAIDELDGMYPYFGRPVYISGNGLRPVLDEETKEPLREVWGYGPGTLAEHNGFAVVPINDGLVTRHMVLQQVYTSFRTRMISPTVHEELKFFEYMDLDSVCLPVDEFEDVFYDQAGDDETTDLVVQINAVIEQSKTLTSILNSRSFRKLTQDKQQRKLDTLISQTEEQAKLRGAELMAEAEYGYINTMDGNLTIKSIDIGNVVISGECLGLESLESLVLKAQAIRKAADLVDKYAGICLVLDPDEDTRKGLLLDKDQIIYLPVAQSLAV